MIFFGGGGALALDDGACDPLLFQKGGIFPTTLKGHSYHLIFHIKCPSGVHADRNIKDSYWRLCYYSNRKKKKWFTIQRLQVGQIDFMSPRTHMS